MNVVRISVSVLCFYSTVSVQFLKIRVYWHMHLSDLTNPRSVPFMHKNVFHQLNIQYDSMRQSSLKHNTFSNTI